MTRQDAAAIFERIATLLELKGENPFKTRAYRTGAEIVESFSGDIMKLAAENRHPRAMALLSLYYLKGIGVKKEYATAKTWAKRAIEKGQPMGYRVLGEIGLEEAKKVSVIKDDKKQRSETAEAIRKAHEDLQHGADLGDRGSLRLLGTE